MFHALMGRFQLLELFISITYFSTVVPLTRQNKLQDPLKMSR